MRDTLIRALGAALERDPSVLAAGIFGAAAFGRADAYSDIDLVVVAPRDAAEAVIACVDAALDATGGVAARWRVPSGASPDYDQCLYRPAGAPEWLMVDLSVLWPDRAPPFMDPERHGHPIVLFDRAGVLVPQRDTSLAPAFAARLARLAERTRMLGHLPGKNVARGHFVEALDAYHSILLRPLVEVLRARYSPHRQDFALRYLHHDLPAEVYSRLEALFAVGGLEALGPKVDEARGWLEEELGRAVAYDAPGDSAAKPEAMRLK